MPKVYRRSLATRVSEFLGGVAAASEPLVESDRNRRRADLRDAWITSDRMIGICKF